MFKLWSGTAAVFLTQLFIFGLPVLYITESPKAAGAVLAAAACFSYIVPFGFVIAKEGDEGNDFRRQVMFLSILLPIIAILLAGRSPLGWKEIWEVVTPLVIFFHIHIWGALVLWYWQSEGHEPALPQIALVTAPLGLSFLGGLLVLVWSIFTGRIRIRRKGFRVIS